MLGQQSFDDTMAAISAMTPGARTHEGGCAANRNALQSRVPVPIASERMTAMRDRRRARGLRELRLIVPDVRSKAVCRRIAR